MKKYLLILLLLLLYIFCLKSVTYAAIPTARIITYGDGAEVCSYSASTIPASLNLFSTTTGSPTSIEYSYRLKDEAFWAVIGSTGPALVMPWDISSLTNGGIYELRAIASNTDGTDPSPGFIWLKVNQNPQVNFNVGGTVINLFNGELYVKAGTLEVYSIYTNVFAQARKMDTSITPSISLTPKDKSAISGNVNTWSTTTVSSDTVKQTFNLDSTTGEGEAVLSISGAKDVNGFTQDAFSTTLIIDTQNPSVTSIQVDEDGDGFFTDNTGYVRNGQTPRFYITFNESIFSIDYASFTPLGKTPVAMVGPTWIDAEQTMCYFTPPAAISDTTGDGLAGIVIGRFKDAALNSQDYTATNLVTIDGTVPRTPIITSPADNITADEGDVIAVELQDPTDTDISYASLTLDGVNFYYDDYAPYQFPVFISHWITTITVTFVDNAGNTSAASVVNITVNPLVDKTVPHALITTITVNTWPTRISLRANVNDQETNIKKVEFQYSNDNSTWTTIGTDSKNDDNFLVNWDITGLTTGTYYLRAIATDNIGNADSSPSVTTIWISNEGNSIEITETSAKVDPIYYIQGSMDTTTHTITAHINSSSQPNVAMRLDDIYTGEINFILPSQITVTGSGTSWDATVTNAAITSSVYANIGVYAQNSNGETIYRDGNVGATSVDIKKDSTLPIAGTFGLIYTINAGSFKDNTNVIIKTAPAVSTTQAGLYPVGPIYDLSLANGVSTFSPIFLTFGYPNTANTGGMYANSTIQRTKLTVCYWNENTQKWVRDKNLTHYAAGNSNIQVGTNHFSKFSVIADYAKPVVTDIFLNNDVISAKVIDDGSGITDAAPGSHLKIDGVTYYATRYDQDTNLIVFKAPLTDARDYPYLLRIIDQVGNYTEYSGILTYTDKEELTNAHNFPNPFDPDREDTTIRFIVTEDSTITIRIYDFNGNLVTILQRNDIEPYGLREYKWGGTNDNGKKVANGIYFAEILASGGKNDSGRTVRKIIKIAVVRRQEE